MKNLFRLLVIAMPLNIFALAEGPKSHVKFCSKEISKQLKDLKSVSKWQFIPPAHPDDKVFRSPTQKIGEWVEVKLKPASHALLSFNVNVTSTWIYSAQNCSPTKTESPSFVRLDANGFTDKDLKVLLGRKQTSLIYIWDPAAGLSLSTAMVYLTEARKHNFEVVSILSPSADLKWAENELKSHKLKLSTKRLSSLELVMRGGNLHSPSIFFVGGNKISDRLMGGLEDKNVGRFFHRFERSMK